MRQLTLEQEAKDFKSYRAFLRYLHIDFPIPENLRPVLDARIQREYDLIQKKESDLPARFRQIVCRIVKMYEERTAGNNG